MTQAIDIQFRPLLWLWQEGVNVGVPWDMPKELIGWIQPKGRLKGHESNILNPLADHPEAEWDPVLISDQQARPLWVQ